MNHNLIKEALAEYEAQFPVIADPLESPTNTAKYLKLHIANTGDVHKEYFGIVYLGNDHSVISTEIIQSGTINTSSVYPREVVKAVLRNNAAAVIFFHNHPSGKCEPSIADERITKQLISALEIFDVRVLDHMIVSHLEHTSFAERGLI